MGTLRDTLPETSSALRALRRHPNLGAGQLAAASGWEKCLSVPSTQLQTVPGAVGTFGTAE